jgi:hypothetical protein
MTMGLTLRRTALRISRLKGADTLILSGYPPPRTSDPRLSGALHWKSVRHRLIADGDDLNLLRRHFVD